MTSADSVRRATGMVIGEGAGGAVSAATCAGERIPCAASQPASVMTTSAASDSTAMRDCRDVPTAGQRLLAGPRVHGQ